MPGMATLGGKPFLIDPSQVQWDFAVKAAEKMTVGGKVVQVFGTKLGDMVVSGSFGFGDRAAGDEAGWEYQSRYLGQVQRWAAQSVNNGAPLRFTFTPRGWDFHVYIKAYSGRQGPAVGLTPTEFNPAWTLTFFIVEDNTGVIVKATRDIYISRLLNGVGWKQTKYNGPKQEEVDALLSPYGGDIGGYIAAQAGDAASGGDTDAP